MKLSKTQIKEIIKETIKEEYLNSLLEKNIPTNPSKWNYYKSQAKKKFDVYPSAYANAWAAKMYKKAGGGWKKGKKENIELKKKDKNSSIPFGSGYDKIEEKPIEEAEYQGKKVELGKVKRGGDKKFYVYVKDPKTKNVKKVSFGDTTGLSIKTKDPDRRRNFRARHNCDNPGPKTKARYWSCRMWSGPDAVKNMLKK